jgi:hypothetical protein
MTEFSRSAHSRLTASPEPALLRLGIVLGVCLPFWAGVAWLVSAWL